ncbi:hypothetical protein AbraIFM66951_008073, partial [Aspergillus brasiliensis]
MLEQPNDWGGCNVFSSVQATDQPFVSIGEMRQNQIHRETRPNGPSQITPNSTETAGSVGQLAVEEIDASSRLNNTFAYGTNTESGGERPPTPRVAEIDREEATIDLQAVNWEHH